MANRPSWLSVGFDNKAVNLIQIMGAEILSPAQTREKLNLKKMSPKT